jgi:hypothetical protein
MSVDSEIDNDKGKSDIDHRKSTVVRSVVLPKSDPRKYRKELREDFLYSCAYCGLMESEAVGIEFQVDHYNPHQEDRADYSNLFWACSQCNRRKSDYYVDPHVDGKLDNGQFAIVKLDEHLLEEHIAGAGADYSVSPLTNVGTATIEFVGLNRPALMVIRRLRAELGVALDQIVFGLYSLRGRTGFSPAEAMWMRSFARDKATAVESIIDKFIEYVRIVAASPLVDAMLEPESEADTELRKMLRRQGAMLPTLSSRLSKIRKARAGKRAGGASSPRGRTRRKK